MQSNQIQFAGYAGKDAQVKVNDNGKKSVFISLCNTEKGKDGQPDRSTWMNVKVAGAWCESAEKIKKGDNVMVMGKVEVTQYKDKKDGTDKTYFGIFAFSIDVFQKREKKEGAGGISQSDLDDIPF